MDPPGILVSMLHLFCQKHPKSKGKNWEQITGSQAKLAPHQMREHQDNIPCLGIREDVISEHVGIRILESSGKCQKRRQDKGL